MILLLIGLTIFIALMIFQYTFWETDQKLALEETEMSVHNVLQPIVEDSLIKLASLVHRDEQNRLHCSDGPAVIFDNTQINRYFWHGAEIPRVWIEKPGHLTVFLALSQENIERRQAACDIIGWTKILNEIHFEIIDQDGDPEIGELIEATIPGTIGRQRFLRVRCGTGRNFVLVVPPDINTALAANAWTYDIDPEVFRPEVRT